MYKDVCPQFCPQEQLVLIEIINYTECFISRTLTMSEVHDLYDWKLYPYGVKVNWVSYNCIQVLYSRFDIFFKCTKNIKNG